jgi:hypothetical protein
VRNTTFWFLTGSVQILIPSLILIAILASLLRINTGRTAIYQP